MPFEDPTKILRRHGLRASRRFSQNYLTSESAVSAISKQVVARSTSARVIEIGPGVGTLTQALLDAGLLVVALEADPRMVDVLRLEFADAIGNGSLELVLGDATKANLSSFAESPTTVCGNLPYALTGTFFRMFMEQSSSVEAAVLMVQKEVASRTVAAPNTKSYGALSVFLQQHFTATHLFDVPSGSFSPPPKVDSAVIALETVDNTIDAALFAQFEALVRSAFQKRRKTLRNAWKHIDGAKAAAEAAGVDVSLRGEALSFDDFRRVAQALSQS